MLFAIGLHLIEVVQPWKIVERANYYTWEKKYRKMLEKKSQMRKHIILNSFVRFIKMSSPEKNFRYRTTNICEIFFVFKFFFSSFIWQGNEKSPWTHACCWKCTFSMSPFGKNGRKRTKKKAKHVWKKHFEF